LEGNISVQEDLVLGLFGGERLGESFVGRGVEEKY
jgi:hypothetical protein